MEGGLVRQLGVPVRAGRNTALVDNAATVPAKLLSDLLGLSITGAVRWIHIAACLQQCLCRRGPRPPGPGTVMRRSLSTAAVGVQDHAQRGERLAFGVVDDVHPGSFRIDQARLAQL